MHRFLGFSATVSLLLLLLLALSTIALPAPIPKHSKHKEESWNVRPDPNLHHDPVPKMRFGDERLIPEYEIGPDGRIRRKQRLPPYVTPDAKYRDSPFVSYVHAIGPGPSIPMPTWAAEWVTRTYLPVTSSVSLFSGAPTAAGTVAAVAGSALITGVPYAAIGAVGAMGTDIVASANTYPAGYTNMYYSPATRVLSSAGTMTAAPTLAPADLGDSSPDRVQRNRDYGNAAGVPLNYYQQQRRKKDRYLEGIQQDNSRQTLAANVPRQHAAGSYVPKPESPIKTLGPWGILFKPGSAAAGANSYGSRPRQQQQQQDDMRQPQRMGQRAGGYMMSQAGSQRYGAVVDHHQPYTATPAPATAAAAAVLPAVADPTAVYEAIVESNTGPAYGPAFAPGLMPGPNLGAAAGLGPVEPARPASRVPDARLAWMSSSAGLYAPVVASAAPTAPVLTPIVPPAGTVAGGVGRAGSNAARLPTAAAAAAAATPAADSSGRSMVLQYKGLPGAKGMGDMRPYATISVK